MSSPQGAGKMCMNHEPRRGSTLSGIYNAGIQKPKGLTEMVVLIRIQHNWAIRLPNNFSRRCTHTFHASSAGGAIRR